MTEVVAPVVVTPSAIPAVASAVSTPTPAAPVVAPVVPVVTAATPSAPAVVDFKFDPVDGVAPEFDASVVATAKALGWDLETAKKFRDHEINLARSEMSDQTKSAESAKAAEVQRVAQEDAAWEKDNRAHPEFGGQKFDQTTIKIDQLLAEYDKGGNLSKHLAQAPRLKSEPSFRSFLASLAYAHGEGRFVQGGSQQTNSQQSASLSEMYPSMAAKR